MDDFQHPHSAEYVGSAGKIITAEADRSETHDAYFLATGRDAVDRCAAVDRYMMGTSPTPSTSRFLNKPTRMSTFAASTTPRRRRRGTDRRTFPGGSSAGTSPRATSCFVPGSNEVMPDIPTQKATDHYDSAPMPQSLDLSTKIYEIDVLQLCNFIESIS